MDLAQMNFNVISMRVLRISKLRKLSVSTLCVMHQRTFDVAKYDSVKTCVYLGLGHAGMSRREYTANPRINVQHDGHRYEEGSHR